MGEQTTLRTALVLAGGKGERLRPLTDDRPKPMVEVAGAPILVHHLRWLRSNGIERAVLLTGYMHKVIEDFFSQPRVDGLTVECVAEDHPLGRGGAFRNGFEQAGIADDVVVATNGDVLTEQPLAEMLALHHQRDAQVTLLLVQMVSPYGIVEVDEQGGVSGFREKPVLPHWINAGAYLINREVFAEFPSEGDHEMTIFPSLAERGRIAGFRCHGFWTSIESPKDLRVASERFGTAAAG